MDPTTWNIPFPAVAGALFVIVMCRANGTYWLGRAAAAGTERTRARSLLHSSGFRKASAWITRWGAPVVTLSFLTVGIQTVVNAAAGAMRMPLRRYLPAVTVGSILWALIYATVGFAGLAAFRLLWARSPAVAVIVTVVLIGALAWWIASQVRSAQAPEPAGTPAEVSAPPQA